MDPKFKPRPQTKKHITPTQKRKKCLKITKGHDSLQPKQIRGWVQHYWFKL